MAISPYSGNNTIRKFGNYYFAYRTDDYYSPGVYGLISTDAVNWRRMDEYFSDFNSLVVRSIGYNPISRAVYLVRAQQYSNFGGQLDTLTSAGDHVVLADPFSTRYRSNTSMFQYNGNYRFFSESGLLEFNTTDFSPSTADTPYLNFDRDSGNRANIVGTPTGVVRIDYDYGVYITSYANPDQWVKIAQASEIEYFNQNVDIQYIVYLNGQFYIHLLDQGTSEYKIIKSVNGYETLSEDVVAGFQREPSLYDNGTYVRRGTWTTVTRQFETSADGVTWTTLSSVTGLVSGSSFGFVKYLNGQYFFTHGSGSTTRTLYRTSNLTSATSSLSGGVIDVAFNGSVYMAATNSGTVYTSPDAITWTAVTTPDFTGLTRNNLYAIGTDFVFTDSVARAFLVTSDAGLTWTRKNLPTIIDGAGISSSGTEEFLKFGSVAFLRSFGSGSGESVYGDFVMVSNDLGDTWNYTVEELQSRIRPSYFSNKIVPLNSGEVLFARSEEYADVLDADKIPVSLDGGSSWTVINTGINVPLSVSESYGVYRDLYFDGTKYIFMITDAGYTTTSFYSSTDLNTWQEEAVGVAVFSGGAYSSVNAPRLYMIGNARLLALDFNIYDDWLGTTISSSTLMYSESGYSNWQNKILISEDGEAWNFVNSTETATPYIIGSDNDSQIYGNIKCTDLVYDSNAGRVVVLGVGKEVTGGGEPPPIEA